MYGDTKFSTSIPGTEPEGKLPKLSNVDGLREHGSVLVLRLFTKACEPGVNLNLGETNIPPCGAENFVFTDQMANENCISNLAPWSFGILSDSWILSQGGCPFKGRRPRKEK